MILSRASAVSKMISILISSDHYMNLSLSQISNKTPRLHLYVAQFVLLIVLMQTLIRVAFFFQFSSPTDPTPFNEILWSFYLGVKFDLQLSAILSLPLLLLGWIKPIHPVYSQLGKRLWMPYLITIIFSLLAFNAANFGFFSYLDKSIDATSLRFLKNPIISMQMVWESYPVILGGIILIVIGIACTALLRAANKRIDDSIHLYQGWKAKTGVVIITFFIVFTCLFGKLSWYPLRWSDAFFSGGHPFTASVASNPPLYFYNTLKNQSESFDLEATRNAYPLMVDYLGIDQPDIENLNYTRKVTFDTDKNVTPPNIVIVVLESFASYKTGLSGNPLAMTPNVDYLAKNGKYFKNFFVPSAGTARSIWTLMTSLPDIEKHDTSTRNPLIVNQQVIMDSLQGYKKIYMLGGSASWGNIRGLLGASVEDIEIYEEGSYTEPSVDVWGISDLSLFREANTVFKQTNKPFLAVIQTSGNHGPYTIPEDNDGFEILSEEQLGYDFLDYGFRELDEVNAFRLMDHSVGRFIAMAKQEAYFDNTIFMFFGDHGLGHRTGKHTPISEDLLSVSVNRVPYIIYSPKLIDKAEVIDYVASSIDVMPTAASLTRTSYINTTLGRDLLDPQFKGKHYAFTIAHGSKRTIGLMANKFWMKMNFDGSNQRLYELETETPRNDVASEHPQKVQEMSELTKALNATTRYIRENNRSHSASQTLE